MELSPPTWAWRRPANFNATQGTSIAAWDVTVRANLASTVNITGRVFTYYLALFTAGNGLPVNPTIYAVTRDAYKYRIDLRGMDPNGWLVYGNQVGFLDFGRHHAALPRRSRRRHWQPWPADRDPGRGQPCPPELSAVLRAARRRDDRSARHSRRRRSRRS